MAARSGQLQSHLGHPGGSRVQFEYPYPYPYPYPLLRERVCTADVGPSVASPDATPRHPPRAREGPWRFLASSVQLYSLCRWMPKALATELGARTITSRSCEHSCEHSIVPTWRAVPASGWCFRRQPAPCTPPSSSLTPRCFKVTVLKAFARYLARALLAKAPPSRSGLVVTGGKRAAVLELELPKAALSPRGRFTAEPPPEGWSALYLRKLGPRIMPMSRSCSAPVDTVGFAPLGGFRARFSKARAERALSDDLCGAL